MRLNILETTAPKYNKQKIAKNNPKIFRVNFTGLSEAQINKRAQDFMETIGQDFSTDKKTFIIVSHVVPNSIPFIKALNKYGRISGIVAKPNSIIPETYDYIKSLNIPFIKLSKQQLKQNGVIKDKIMPVIKPDESLIIFDVGGYFAYSLDELNGIKTAKGIVEDTENGYQKYEKQLGKTANNIPIYSIARNRVKSYEDYLVGRSIAEATLRTLNKNGINIKNKKIGIIGYGEVGKGAAYYLKHYLGIDVSIFDHAKDVQEQIKKHGYKDKSKEELLADSDVIICATGNKSITKKDLTKIKQGAYIASCTSSDDEFEIDFSKSIETGYKLNMLEGLFFLNNGNAINFITPRKHGRMIEPYIHLTNSGLIKCATYIDSKKDIDCSRINTLNKIQEEDVISGFYKALDFNNKNKNFIENINLIV